MKNFHVVRVAPVVNLTLRQEIESDSKYKELSYHDFLHSLLQEHYNYGDVFSHYMNVIGNQAEEIVYDVESLQKRWAQENDVKIEPGEQWQLKIVLEQLKKMNPDVIYLQGFTRITAKAIYEVMDEIPNLKKVAVHSGFPNGEDVVTSDTIIFAGFPNIYKTFSELGCDTHLLYHFFDERVLNNISSSEKNIPFSFVGTTGYGYGPGHKTRYWELLKLAHSTPLHGWFDDKDGFEDPNEAKRFFVDKPMHDYVYHDLNDDISQYPNPITQLRNLVAPERVHKPVYGWDYFQLLHDSMITYQRHTDAMAIEIGAMRVFQATGVGSCLVTNDGVNMRDLYDPDTEVVTYSSLEECVEKVNYLINHPKVASDIAQKGQERTLRSHNAKERYAQVHEILSRAIYK